MIIFQIIRIPSGFEEEKYSEEDSERFNFANAIESGDVDLILIQAPVGTNIERLHGQKISVDGNSHFKCEDRGGSYDTFFHKDIPSELRTSLLLIPDTSSNQLKPHASKLSGYLTFVESIDLQETHYPPAIETTVPVPDGLKQRYIPYGADDPKRKKHKKKREHQHSPGKSRKFAQEHSEANGKFVSLNSSPEVPESKISAGEEKLNVREKKKKKSREKDKEHRKRHRENSSEIESQSYNSQVSQDDEMEHPKKKKKSKKK